MADDEQVADQIWIRDRISGLRTEPEIRNVAEGGLPYEEVGRVLAERAEVPAEQVKRLRGRQIERGTGVHAYTIILRFAS